MTMKITKIIGGVCSVLVALWFALIAQEFFRHVVLPVIQQSQVYIIVYGHKLVVAQVFTLSVSFAVASVALIFVGCFLLIRRRNAA